jgi:hypothetical protein
MLIKGYPGITNHPYNSHDVPSSSMFSLAIKKREKKLQTGSLSCLSFLVDAAGTVWNCDAVYQVVP